MRLSLLHPTDLLVVIVKPIGIDQCDEAFTVFSHNFFCISLDLFSQLGKVGPGV